MTTDKQALEWEVRMLLRRYRARAEQSAGQDAANRNMKRNGRTKWNKQDWDAAVETFHRPR